MKEKIKEKLLIILNTEDDTENFTLEEIESGKTLSLVAYLIPLIPFILSKKNNYIHYHTTNGMNLLFTYLVFLIVKRTLSYIFGTPCDLINGIKCMILPLTLRIIFSLVNMFFSFIVLYGILNVCNNRARKLPLIDKIHFLNRQPNNSML